MRKSFAAVLSAVALGTPTAGTAATTLHVAEAKVVTKKVTGQPVAANRWGTVVINVTAKTTTKTGSNKTTWRYINLGGNYTYHTSRSQYIMSQALPLLRQEFLTAQSTNIQMISGATFTSQAFEQSLQSALAKLHA